MITYDELGKTREYFHPPLTKEYHSAFNNINNDDNQELIAYFQRNLLHYTQGASSKKIGSYSLQ